MMGESMPISELEHRLHQLDSRLKTAAEHFRTTGVLLPDDEDDLERLRARSSSLRRKLGNAKGQITPDTRLTLETEWRSLGAALRRWADRIDREYGQS